MSTHVQPLLESFRRQVERIVDSEAFRGSETLRKLLEYLADRVLENASNAIKAKEIAAAVFGRVKDFDPQNDSIVRVHTARLRARLAEYYISEGAEDDLVMTIPKGSYVLLFHHRAAPPANSGDAAADGVGAALRASPAPDGPPRTEPRSFRPPRATVWYALGLIAAIVGTWLVASTTHQASGRTHLAPGLATFWRSFLTNEDRALVVYSNIWVHDSIKDRDLLLPSNGEVFGVFQMTRFFTSLQKAVYPKHGKLLTWDEAKDADLIFVGGPLAETPLRTVSTLRDFAFARTHDKDQPGAGATGVIENLRPKKDEAASFVGSPRPEQFDYAIVSMTAAHNSKRRAVTLAGISGYGTQGAAEFVTREDRIAELLSRLSVSNGAPMPLFEAVVRFNVQGEVAIQPQIVAAHRLD
jgi:phosphohistidine phosphatase SixA